MSEVKFSELNDEHRIDAEYFVKENLLEEKILSDFGTLKIGDIATVTDGIHTSIDYDENSRVNLISATSPKENVFDLSRGAFISKKAHAENPRTALRKNDVIISTVGTIGNCAVVDDSILPANSDRHVGIVRISNDYSPYVLSTFLLSKYGRMQTLRESTGNVQLNLFIYKLRELQIPNFSTDFQQQIESLVKSAHEKLSRSKSLYAQAEDTLLSELGLKDLQPKNEEVSIKTFSDFASSGRLDAEYYQSKYDEIEAKIKSVSHKTLNEIADIQDANFNPNAKTLYKYIELADIGSSGEITGCTEDLGENLPSRARRIVHTGDILVSSIEGSLQSCAIVPKGYDDALCSTGFYVLKALAMNSETLLILLKSEIMQQLLKKGCSGTILTAISKDELKRVIVPILPQETQEQIADYIQRSFTLRAESKWLLNEAKASVEREIEK
ncbi:MAG: restriction endonuclease subunit S [Treponemataceae bacterium]|nr:restriction endonuclease subunit S [Treponemataceae bacterium]